MKITYLCQSYPPMISGAALVVQRHAQAIACAGHEVVVMCASDENRSYTSWSNGVQVIRLRSIKNPLRVQQRFILRPKAEIASLLETFRPDIVHFHDPLTMALDALDVINHMADPPVKILTLHQLPWFVSLYFPQMRGLIETALWKYGTYLMKIFNEVITPSETIADIVGAHTGRRPIVISNGVDLERFTSFPEFPNEREVLLRKYNLDPDLPVILYIGRVDTDKRVDLLIHAVAQALHSIDAQLLIVGSGQCLPQIIELTKELHIHHLSHFPGFVSPIGDLPGLFRLGSVFCTPSVIEIQSSVVLEAEATGLPVVAFRASSMPELVTDGESGYLVPPGDTTAMADRIVTLLRNPTQAQAMGRAGLQIAQSHSHHHSLQAHMALYVSLLLSPAHRRMAASLHETKSMAK